MRSQRTLRDGHARYVGDSITLLEVQGHSDEADYFSGRGFFVAGPRIGLIHEFEEERVIICLKPVGEVDKLSEHFEETLGEGLSIQEYED